jgi:hypothetical protein
MSVLHPCLPNKMPQCAPQRRQGFVTLKSSRDYINNVIGVFADSPKIQITYLLFCGMHSKACATKVKRCSIRNPLYVRTPAEGGATPLVPKTFTRSGWSTLVALEVTTLRTMLMNFALVQPSERFMCKSIVECRPLLSIRFQAAIKGSISDIYSRG